MYKGKEWLKEEVNAQNIILDKGYIYTEDILKLIDQLEEPEQEKVVIPQFVADWIEECREMDVRLGESFNTHYEDNREIHTWIYNSDDKNSEIYTRAWLDGYTVEKEPQYHVKLFGNLCLRKSTDGEGDIAIGSGRLSDGFTDKLTEKEIKAIDERYWAFAEESTE